METRQGQSGGYEEGKYICLCREADTDPRLSGLQYSQYTEWSVPVHVLQYIYLHCKNLYFLRSPYLIIPIRFISNFL
jgi:hypothetical protein